MILIAWIALLCGWGLLFHRGTYLWPLVCFGVAIACFVLA